MGTLYTNIKTIKKIQASNCPNPPVFLKIPCTNKSNKWCNNNTNKYNKILY